VGNFSHISTLSNQDGLLITRHLGLARIPIGAFYLVHTLTNQSPDPMAAAVEAYCVKCKAKRNMKDAKEVVMANGRKAMKGTCPECSTGMFKIMGK
jgi:hypothetical protein